jgi:hypothetical protein
MKEHAKMQTCTQGMAHVLQMGVATAKIRRHVMLISKVPSNVFAYHPDRLFAKYVPMENTQAAAIAM